MKKLSLVVLVCLTLGMVLTGCNQDTSNTGGTTPSTNAPAMPSTNH